MALLMLLVISHCIPPTAVAEKCEKPVIRVITEGSTRTGSKVMIECSSSSNYTIKGCTFYKNELTLHTNTFSTQYVIENATASDEGFYTCECYTDKNHTETSFRVPLILNNQVDEPDIRIEENGNKIICSSRNSSYKYRLCILYQNDLQINDTATKYNKDPTGEVSFTVPHLPGETRFTCLCYTNTSGWTRNSSAITKGKLSSTTTKSTPKLPTKKETTATTMSPTTATTTKTMPLLQSTTSKGITTTATNITGTSDSKGIQDFLPYIIVACILILLAALCIPGGIYISKQKKKKEEGVTGASPDGQNEECALQVVNPTADQPSAPNAADQPTTENDDSGVTYVSVNFQQATEPKAVKDDSGVTYASVNFQQATKPKACDDVPTDPSVLYASLTPNKK